MSAALPREYGKTSADRPLRILLSGPGLIGKKHAQLLDQSRRSILAAVVAPESSRNIAFAAERGVPLFGSISEAFESAQFDGVIIASPNQFHTEQALACIERGIPALVEKPLAADLDSAAVICAAAKAGNVPILVGHHRTYSGLLRVAQDFIRSDRFGEIVSVQGSALFRKPEHYFEEGPWRKFAGGGPILINLIHDIGILRFLCGPIKAVSAMSSNSGRRFEVEDTAAIILRFEKGALGTFVLSDIAASDRSWEATSGENPAYPRSFDTACYHIAGTNGSLDFPTMQVRYYGADRPPSWWTPFQTAKLPVEPVDPLEKQLAHFEAVLAGEADPLVSADEGLANMQVVQAIQQAIASGGTVELENSVTHDMPAEGTDITEARRYA